MNLGESSKSVKKWSFLGHFKQFDDFGRIFYGCRIFYVTPKKFFESENRRVTIAHLQNVNIFISFESVRKT